MSADHSESWLDLLNSKCVCLPLAESDTRKLFLNRQLTSVAQAARERNVSEEILARYIRVSEWPTLCAAIAAGGATLAEDYIAIFEVKVGLQAGSLDVRPSDFDVLFEHLPLFQILASHNRTRVPDEFLFENATRIAFWFGKVAEAQESEGVRARRILNRARTRIKRAAERSDADDALNAVFSLPDRFWRIFREGVRKSGCVPLKRMPVNIDALARVIDIAITHAPLDAHDLKLNRRLIELRRQLYRQFSFDPVDFPEHWRALGDDQVARIEAVADQSAIELWQDPMVDTSEILIGIDTALSLIRVGQTPKSDKLHAYKVLVMSAQNLTGKRSWTNAEGVPDGELVRFVKSVSRLYTSMRFSDHLFRQAITEVQQGS